jgi:hypothetical protein
MSSIGIEVLRIALEDVVTHQQEIKSLVNNRETDKDVIKLIDDQTQLLESTINLFNRLY